MLAVYHHLMSNGSLLGAVHAPRGQVYARADSRVSPDSDRLSEFSMFIRASCVTTKMNSDTAKKARQRVTKHMECSLPHGGLRKDWLTAWLQSCDRAFGHSLLWFQGPSHYAPDCSRPLLDVGPHKTVAARWELTVRQGQDSLLDSPRIVPEPELTSPHSCWRRT